MTNGGAAVGRRPSESRECDQATIGTSSRLAVASHCGTSAAGTKQTGASGEIACATASAM